ncbi:2-C-methyl-D-erythritol 2,4-cyclodiphosphate synthase [Salirhabdus salicampi]|nr:2-C-methyl-D-erythritol 2,4-cyclodiphosphate synthase [Salirhabdus salicampi]
MKLGKNKQFLSLADKPLLIHTLQVFEQDEQCTDIYLVVNPIEVSEIKEIVHQYNVKKVTAFVPGGKERQQSVYEGLKACRPEGIVFIHDGARPFVQQEKLNELAVAVEEKSAALLAVPVTDTIKKVDQNGCMETLDRKQLWAAQTPQGFQYDVITSAHEKAMEEGYIGTDDTSLVERTGHLIEIVEGSYRNFKLTTPEDIEKANRLLENKQTVIEKEETSMFKIGQGFDVHQFAEGRPCIIGGVHIPYEKGLLGHSDADVLLHTITDACLGAIGEGDIGKHFPDNDPAFKDADSKELLKHVWQMVINQGYCLGNLDCTIIAQAPKMAPYIEAMRESVANILEVDVSQINIKATTTEKLGFTGRKEGIASQAVVLLQTA